MPKYKRFNIRIHSNCNANHLSNIVNNYHADLIESHLNGLPLSNNKKIEIIDKIIYVLKSNDLNN